MTLRTVEEQKTANRVKQPNRLNRPKRVIQPKRLYQPKQLKRLHQPNRLNRPKITGIITAAVLLLSMISGCRNGQSTTPPPAPPPTPPASTLPADEPPDEPYQCQCGEPAGELAPHSSTRPAQINTRTPGDTFVAGVTSMEGSFLQGWSRDSNDISVAELTGGYKDTFCITSDGRIEVNSSVICALDTEYDTEGNKTYTFTLHNYIKWSNGEPLTARDYVAGVLAYAYIGAFAPPILKPGGKTVLSNIWHIKGTAEGDAETTGSDAAGADLNNADPAGADPAGVDLTGPLPYIEGIYLLDDYRFSAVIGTEYLPYFWEMEYVTFRPVYTDGWFPGLDIVSDENGTRFSAEINNIEANIFQIATQERYAPSVTCGPYRFLEYDGESVKLERNEYFGVCSDGYIPYFRYILLTKIPAEKGAEMLAEGKIDYLAGAADPDDIDMDAEIILYGGSPDADDAGPGGSPDGDGDGANPDAGPGSSPDADDAGPGSDGTAGTDADGTAGTDGDGAGYTAEPQVGRLGDYIKLQDYIRAGYGFIEFKLDTEPFDDYNVRLAFSMMIDRDMLIEQAFNGRADLINAAYSPAQWMYIDKSDELGQQTYPIVLNPGRASGLLDATQWIYEADGETLFDREKAADIAEAAGNAQGATQGTGGESYLRHNAAGEPLRITVASSSEKIAEALRAAAYKAPLLGIEFIVELTNAKMLLESYYYRDTLPEAGQGWNAYQLAFDFTPFHDMYWYYHSAMAGTYLNPAGIRDGELDRITMAMRSLTPGQAAEHAALWLEFQARWQQILPALPLYSDYRFNAMNTIVTQVPVTDYLPWHSVVTYIAKH